MAVTGVKRKDKGKESRRTRATPRSQRRELAFELQVPGSGRDSTEQLRAGRSCALHRPRSPEPQPLLPARSRAAASAKARWQPRGWAWEMPGGWHPPSFSARAAATTRVITRCSAPSRPAAALRGPQPRLAAGSTPAPADVEAAAAPAAPPPARFPIPAGRGPPRSRSGAALLGEAAAAAAREPWSGLWPRRRGRERFRAQGSGSGRGCGSVRACEQECQSRPRPRHRLRRVEAERPRVKHGGRPYWKRARAAGSGRWPARGGARPWAPPPPCRHLWGQQVSLPRSPWVQISWPALGGSRFRLPDRTRAVQPQPVTAAPRRRRREAGPGPSRQDLWWRFTLRRGNDGNHVEARRPCRAAALGCGRGREELRGTRGGSPAAPTRELLMHLWYCNARAFQRTECASGPRGPERKIHSSDSSWSHLRLSASWEYSWPDWVPGGASLRTGTRSIHRCIFKAHSPEALKGIILLLELCLLSCEKTLCCVYIKQQWSWTRWADCSLGSAQWMCWLSLSWNNS